MLGSRSPCLSVGQAACSLGGDGARRARGGGFAPRRGFALQTAPSVEESPWRGLTPWRDTLGEITWRGGPYRGSCLEEIPYEGSNITEEEEEPVCQVVKVLPTDSVRFLKGSSYCI